MSDSRDVPVLPLEELRAHGELVLLVALRLPRPLRRQVVLHATLPVLVVLQQRWMGMTLMLRKRGMAQ